MNRVCGTHGCKGWVVATIQSKITPDLSDSFCRQHLAEAIAEEHLTLCVCGGWVFEGDFEIVEGAHAYYCSEECREKAEPRCPHGEWWDGCCFEDDCLDDCKSLKRGAA